MVSSVPIHPISYKRLGVELGPQNEQPAAGPSGRPPKSGEADSTRTQGGRTEGDG